MNLNLNAFIFKRNVKVLREWLKWEIRYINVLFKFVNLITALHYNIHIYIHVLIYKESLKTIGFEFNYMMENIKNHCPESHGVTSSNNYDFYNSGSGCGNFVQ